MKKNLVIIVVLVLLSIGMKAQDKSKPFNFSIRIGPNISWFKSNSDAVNVDGSVLGFSWGALCEIPAQNNFSFVSGFNIHFAGGKVNYLGEKQGLSALIAEKYTLKYLELPVMLKIRTNEVNGVMYYGQLGLGTAFRLNSRVKRTFAFQGSSGAFAAPEDLNSDNITSFIRESLLVGVGAQYSLQENLKLFGGLNFNNGFTDILKKGPNNTTDPKVISNFVELNVGLYF